MTETQDQNDPPPSLTIDWAKYGAMLDEWDGSDEQKQELISTLWSIVVSFVDLGFDVQAAEEFCGEPDDYAAVTGDNLLDCDPTPDNAQNRARDAFTEATERSPACH